MSVHKVGRLEETRTSRGDEDMVVEELGGAETGVGNRTRRVGIV